MYGSISARLCIGGTQNPDVVKHRAQKKVGHYEIEKGGVKIIGSQCCPVGESVEWRANVESMGELLASARRCSIERSTSALCF
jgi:hypothetical protein